MANEIMTIQNVRAYIDTNGTAWLNAEDVARGLGWTQTQVKNGKEYTSIRWETLNRYLAEFGFPKIVGEKDFIPENMFYRLVWKSRDEKALAFQSKVADEILPTLRRTGTYTLAAKAPTPATDALKDARAFADEIQAEFIGVKRGIAMAKGIDVVEALHGVSLQTVKELLPPAEHETGYLNVTQIAKKLGIKVRSVNPLLEASGLQRADGNEWRLTMAGTAYGEEMPYIKNGHSGYQIRWNDNVVDFLQAVCSTVA